MSSIMTGPNRIMTGPTGIGALLLAVLLVALPRGGTVLALGDGGGHADVCLELAATALPAGAWGAVVAAVDDVGARRTALFPVPTVVAQPVTEPGEDASSSPPATTLRLDVHSGHAGGTAPGTSAACLEPGVDWTARFDRGFLQAAADRMLADAPTTPGISSEIEVEWYPDDARIRTALAFEGPLGIPNGHCWVDDRLVVDPASGVVRASGEEGLETSPFAEGACGRFFDHLPDGGAGEQVVELLPVSVALEDGRELWFVATRVTVRDDAVVVVGVLEAR